MDKQQNTLLGACKARLEGLGYGVCSALTPDVRGYRVADHEAAILTSPSNAECPLPDAGTRELVAIHVATMHPELRDGILALLKKHRLTGGISRTDSAGGVTFVYRWDEGLSRPALTRDTDGLSQGAEPAVSVAGVERTNDPSQPLRSSVIRCDGSWSGGSPLSIARFKLPLLAFELLESVWADINRLVAVHADALPDVPQHLREHYEAGVYKRMDFVAPVYDTDETPPPKSAIRRWYDGFAREWVESR